jgi:hypothetical protein
MSAGKILGTRYIINGNSADVSGFKPDMSVDIYYEVIRLIDGKFLFLPDHLRRLRISLAGSGIEFPGEDILQHHLGLLLEQNSLTLGISGFASSPPRKTERTFCATSSPTFTPVLPCIRKGCAC